MFTVWAGIILIPALLLSSEIFASPYTDTPSTATLTRISVALWAESRHYDDLPESDRLRMIAKDVTFDAWLAEKARAEGFGFTQPEKELISQTEKQLEYQGVKNALIAQIKVTEQEVEQLTQERGWTSPLPPRWEVLYIFVDTTVANTEAEKEALHKRALWLREQLTPDNFRELARLWSDAPSSADGGYLGALTLDGLGPTFTSNIKSTPQGTIGGPYETRSGWNIFYVRSYSPPVERNFSPEKLREMTARVKADVQAREALKSPDAWESLMSELGVVKNPTIKEELTALENFLLAERFIRHKSSRTKPSEDELRVIFNEKETSFEYPPCRKAREILLTCEDWTLETSREAWIKRRAVRDAARELRERILKGEDFAQLARRLSASSTASSGGDLGWIQAPSSPLFDTALAALKVGEVSPPIATDKGYLLLQLQDVRLNQPIPFKEARKKCEEIWNYRQLKRIKEELRAQCIKESSPIRN
jgi:parvulin-like peptidyl-prolyl isomerase